MIVDTIRYRIWITRIMNLAVPFKVIVKFFTALAAFVFGD